MYALSSPLTLYRNGTPCPPTRPAPLRRAHNKRQDVVAAAADCIAARRQGASREAAAALRQELEAVTAYANSLVGLRLPQAVYRKLSEAQVYFS